MKILMCGDVVGRAGRDVLKANIPLLKEKLNYDFLLINVDNAAGGFGITKEIANDFFSLGADVLTGGNHIFDQSSLIPLLDREKRILRPLNLPNNAPGFGSAEIIISSGKKILVLHLMGRKHISMVADDPFQCAKQFLSKYSIGNNIDVILVDFHAELTSEKNAMGHFLDGKVTAVVGTHTHIPTSDQRILTNGTAFQTDLGMIGDYDSVIGMNKNIIVSKFSKVHDKSKMIVSSGEATLCALFVESDDNTGLAKEVKSIRIGGVLSQTEGL